ncbi:GNAT family N-acetyltransferase [Flavobacterium sp. KACC 22761]|uniref:GNAT family N-acetyltransferase n=1 Tax=Flavobacterium sp. KACC 22761 TaxID=3092665 RepID=UPI002A74C0EC|nr:GNAT family N-acetyltransferase [Flavobacterium sp. KACC 22761]WPO78369.1 GNAT family N-acetyltransferase [Flavobacterium sp. KACC 22761]
MNYTYTIKSFGEFTNLELYQMLRLRSEVFVVEQNCVYLDLDNKDQKSFHLLYYVNDELVGCTRLLPTGLSYDEVSIGRVVITPAYRGLGLGKKIMEASITGCEEKFGEGPIRISAQYHLSNFYQSRGFVEQGEPYDEDGIPHIEMLRI